MKKIIMEFLRRGFTAMGVGPLILAVLYLVLQQQGGIEKLTVNQVCVGILSLSGLAFIAGGMNVIYQVERLPLMAAVSVHGGVLYGSYLATYLLNGWLERDIGPMLVFTGIFAAGYLVIWIIIYSVTKRKTAEVNEALLRKQQYIE